MKPMVGNTDMLAIGERVIVMAKSRISDGSHGVVDGYSKTYGVPLRYYVAFTRGRRLTYFRHELLRDTSPPKENGL